MRLLKLLLAAVLLAGAGYLLWLRVIRPLIYTEECAIRSLVRAMELPVYKNPCPVDGETNRAKIEEYLHAYGGKRALYQKILGALENSGIDGWHD